MARVEVPLIGDLAILQGETYQALSLAFPGDLSTWTPRGQIRSKLLEESGTLLAEFSFEASTYDADADTTTVNPRLTPTQTASLPKTKWQGTGEYSKTGVYYYDIELESDTGEVVKSKTAIVQIVGEVTGGNDSIPTPPIVWDGAIDHISLASTNGLINTYTAWGDEEETIDLGSFEVEDGNGIVETSYSVLTGVLTITYADGSTFSTGDIRGEQGIKGDPGLSAYEVAVAGGFAGTESQWIESQKADLDAATIKTRYESNENTNAFTDAEKTALGTALQPSALNNYETTTQLNARDVANRLWTNLTSVPIWIVNATAFGQSLVTAASASAVKTLLALGNVDNTSDINKPISNATQTALNLKADLNNPTFTGTNLILPNNPKINSFEQFYQSATPTTRGDGSVLIAGDRWYRPTDGIDAYWNGTYWVGRSFFSSVYLTSNYSATTLDVGRNPIPFPAGVTQLLCVRAYAHLRWSEPSGWFVAGSSDWEISFRAAIDSSNAQPIGSSSTVLLSSVAPVGQFISYQAIANINSVIDTKTRNTNVTLTRIGTPPNIGFFTIVYEFRPIYS